MSRPMEQGTGALEQFIEHPLQPRSKPAGFADEAAGLLSNSEACYKAFGQPYGKSTSYDCRAVATDKTKDDEIEESRRLAIMARKAWDEEDDNEKALKLMEKAMAIEKKYGIKNTTNMAFSGMLLLDMGRPAEARDYLEEALAVELNDGSDRDGYWIKANLVLPLGQAEAALGNYPQAEKYFQEVINYAREVENRLLLKEALEKYLNDVLYKVWDFEKIGAVMAELIAIRLAPN